MGVEVRQAPGLYLWIAAVHTIESIRSSACAPMFLGFINILSTSVAHAPLPAANALSGAVCGLDDEFDDLAEHC